MKGLVDRPLNVFLLPRPAECFVMDVFQKVCNDSVSKCTANSHCLPRDDEVAIQFGLLLHVI